MIVATGSAIAAVLVGIGTLLVTISNGRKTAAAAARVEEVHVLVDGAQTELKKEIARLSEVIAGLTGKQGDVKNAEVTAGNAKDSVKMSKDLMDKLPNG